MKKILIMLVTVLSVQVGTVLAQSGESQFKDVNITSKKANPPQLIVSATFFDTDGNQALDATEKAKLAVKVKNSGKSDAANLILKVAITNNNSITLESFNNNLGNLSINSEKNIDVHFTAAANLAGGNADIVLTVTEADGYNPEPVTINIKTREAASPLLSITDYMFSSDLGGKVVLGKTVDLNIVIQNNGDGKAENVMVDFKNPDNVFPAGNSSFAFMSIEPGDKQTIKYSFLPNEKFSGTDLTIICDVKEKTTRYGASRDMKVALEQELVATSGVVTGNDADLIYRGGGDPLKGLNTADEKKTMQLGDYYALIIGVDNYKGSWAKLNNAVGDAKTIENLLKGKYKFDYFRTLYDEQATRKEILKEFEWLVANVKETDNVFIYYSGHGEFKKELNKGYWVPSDALTTSVGDYISNNDIQTFLSGIRSKHTLLVADACFSGDLFRGKTVSIPFEDSEKYYVKVHGLSSRKAISSGDIEPVMDGGRDGHSVFAYYLIEALKANALKFYDASQLYEAIKIPVINNSNQTPKFQPIKNTGDAGGQFIFIKK